MAQYSRERLIELARKTVDVVGGQAAAAEILGCSQPLIGMALRVDPADKRRDGVLVRIVQEIGGHQVEIEDRRVFHVAKKGSKE